MPRNRPERHIPGTIVFDVNETLLDISALDPLFSRHFGDTTTRKEWFSQVLLTAMTTTLIGDYADFARVGTAALGMVAERQGVKLAREQEQEILTGMRRLPPHPESETALKALRNAGYQIVALTNSSQQMVHAQIENSGLANYFDQLLSVDAVGKFKPSREVYEMAEKTLAEHPADLWLIAAHNWDTTGALAAGWKAAFVEREGMVTGDLDRNPTVRARDLVEAAQRIILYDS